MLTLLHLDRGRSFILPSRERYSSQRHGDPKDINLFRTKKSFLPEVAGERLNVDGIVCGFEISRPARCTVSGAADGSEGSPVGESLEEVGALGGEDSAVAAFEFGVV